MTRSKRRRDVAPGILIIVENLPARRDRRVWREAKALNAAGYVVSVISPRAPDDVAFREVDGVFLYTYSTPHSGDRRLDFIWEYLSSWVKTALLSLRVWRQQPFMVLQACNPPDIFFPLALVYRLGGVKFVFDHHDLAPELYRTRFNVGGAFWVMLLALERATFFMADHVISTNESYRSIALRRGCKRSDQVSVVRNGPDLDEMVSSPPRPELKEGKPYLCCWFGNMGPHDGVDGVLLAILSFVKDLGRLDCHFAFIGQGECLDEVQRLSADFGLDEWVTFTGWVEDDMAFAYLSTADVGLSLDPSGPLNDVSTMNKTMEYMAFGLPVVAFDLEETRVSAHDSALYATSGDVEGVAQLINELLDDPELRVELGNRGRRRIEESLAWSYQRDRYLQVYEHLLKDRSLPNAGPRDVRSP